MLQLGSYSASRAPYITSRVPYITTKHMSRATNDAFFWRNL